MKLVITAKGAFIRNLATALINGTITLILLLIAPLGLAAVIFNTILVTLSTFVVNSLGDRVVQWLLVTDSNRHQFRATSHPYGSDSPIIPPGSISQLSDQQDGDRRNT